MIAVSESCIKAGFVLKIVVKVIDYLRILIPIILILLIIFDLAKALTSQDTEKAKKEAGNKAVKRFMYALIIFLVPTIVRFVFKQIAPVTSETHTNTNSTGWIECWNFYN